MGYKCASTLLPLPPTNMHRKEFVRQASIPLLNEYFKNKKLKTRLDEAETDLDVNVKKIEAEFLTLDKEKKDEIDGDLETISDMANENGSVMLIEQANKLQLSMPKKFDDYDALDKALWFYVNAHQLFEETYINFLVDNSAGWTWFKVERDHSTTPSDQKIKQFSKQIGEYFQKKQRRGDFCLSEPVVREGDLCIAAYPEDHTKREMTQEAGKFNRCTVFKPLKRVYFLYKPLDGRLGVKTRGKLQTRLALGQIFTNLFLDHDIDETDLMKYNLNLLKNEPDLTVGAEDPIEYARLVSLDVHHASGTQLTLTLRDFASSSAGTADMLEELRFRNLPLDKIDILGAKIFFRMKEAPYKRGRKAITIGFKANGISDIQQKKYHEPIEAVIKKWGLDLA